MLCMSLYYSDRLSSSFHLYSFPLSMLCMSLYYSDRLSSSFSFRSPL